MIWTQISLNLMSLKDNKKKAGNALCRDLKAIRKLDPNLPLAMVRLIERRYDSTDETP